jgi:hypothetical protein
MSFSTHFVGLSISKNKKWYATYWLQNKIVFEVSNPKVYITCLCSTTFVYFSFSFFYLGVGWGVGVGLVGSLRD